MTFSRHILKRALLFVPTLILLLLLTVLLQENMPGDKINVLLDQSEFAVSENQKSRRTQYNQMARESGMDRPGFYCSIAPRNVLKSEKLDDVRFERSKAIWLQTHSNKKVDLFYATLTSDLDQLDVSGNVNDEKIYSKLTALGEASPEQATILIESINNSTMADLKENLEDAFLSEVNWASGLPKVRWNGFDNRFHNSMVDLLKGQWGVSTVDGRHVKEKIGDAIRWTLITSITSLILALLLAFLLGMYSSIKDRSNSERSISAILFGIYAMPLFWLATLFIVFLTTEEYASWLDIFPPVGVMIIDGEQSFMSNLLARGHLLILPIFCLTISSIAFFYQFLLSGNRTEMRKPYFITAMAKGLDHRTALLKHSFVNASYPVIGLMAVIIPGLISGSLVIEVLFNIPGMGRLMFDSILTQDWQTVTTTVLISGILAFIAFLLTDIILYWINPKKLAHV